jgi:hypothetical protein
VTKNLIEKNPNKMQEEILELSQSYVSAGMSFPDAFRKAIQNMKESKYTPLEKKLVDLGCVKWDQLKEITPATLEIVEKFHFRTRSNNFVFK